MNHLVLKWLKKSGLAVPLVTTVTDMVTIHPLWICPSVSRCLVPTEAARRAAIELGMPAEKISVCGQPISLKFNRRMGDKGSLRRKLGLAPERPTVLVMGGGEGFGRVFEVSRSLAQALPQAQLLVVAGRNAALQAQLESFSWEIPTRIYGFVDYIPDLMGAADLLVSKAGPGTISEAFSAGLPVLLYAYIPGQEEGNISYVEAHRAGVYAEAPETIAGLASGWFSPGNSALAEMAGQAARLAHPQAALSIATHACELLKEQPAQLEPHQLRSTWRDSRATRLALRVLRL
jgi:1,2-diacylglycerol 3-beta-galactosyltransferase